MRRSRDWWAALSKGERSWLVFAERQPNHLPMGGDLPDDSSYCPVCGYPQQGSGWCRDCLNYGIDITERANAAIAKAESS